MVIETRGGAQIGVLNENGQGFQQQLVEHSKQFRLINGKLDWMESNFHEFKDEFKAILSGFQSMMEERLPKPSELNHQPQVGQNVNHASSLIREQPSFGE